MVNRNIKIYWYLLKSFTIIGSVSFGGYLALLAMVREKLVVEDKVIDDHRITEAIALGSLLPGPLAVNVVAYVSYLLAGIPGAILSIVAVLLPSYLLVLLLSIFYFEFNSTVNFDFILMGIIPVVIGIIFLMAFTMWRRNCTGTKERIVAILSMLSLIVFTGYWAIVGAIVISGVAGVYLFKPEEGDQKPITFNGFVSYAGIAVMVGIFYMAISFCFSRELNFQLFNRFATVSLTLFGGGYVMIPVLKTLLVDQLSWVTQNEFFLGISLGQITPGPILISAVYFGYKVNGLVGSLLASIGIFLPSSMLMIVASKFYTQVSGNRYIVSALKGIRPAVVGLIIYSGLSLTLTNSLFSHIGYLILLVILSFLVLWNFKISPVIAVIVGGLFGYLTHWFVS
jgi:chromate transporter